MTQEELLGTRARVPGYLAVGIALSLVVDAFGPTSTLTAQDWWVAAGAVVVTALGWAYRSTGLQELVYRHVWVAPVVRNISAKLLEFVPNSSISAEARTQLLADGSLRACLYKLIDGDESLKHKRSIVYSNGAFLGAVTDACFLSVIGIFTHMIKYILAPKGNSPEWFLAWGGLCLASMACIPLSRLRHIRLSNDQLAFIRLHYATEARNCVLRAARQHEGTGTED